LLHFLSKFEANANDPASVICMEKLAIASQSLVSTQGALPCSPPKYKVPPFVREPFEKYLERGKSWLTSHQLWDFALCPDWHQRKKSGLFGSTIKDYFVEGHALHTWILEGREKFDTDFTISSGPINPKTGNPYGTDTKTFQKWSEAQTKPVLTDSQYAMLCQMHHSYLSHPTASDLFTDGVAEGVLRGEFWHVDSQCRLDWFNTGRGIVDLKTCYNIDQFEADAKTFGYPEQMAFYRSMVRRFTGESPQVRFVVIEKREPYRCGVWRVSEKTLRRKESWVRRKLEEYRACQERDFWPTRFERTRII
jgi:hypothetical protein